MKKVFSFFALLVVFGVSGQDFDSAKMDSYLDSLASHDKAMVSVAIMEKGEPVYQKAVGFADVNAKQQATINTRYRVGSITKVFTAVMIFQLIEEDKLSLDTTLDTFYPNIQNARAITISMLLHHRSGIANFTDLPAYGSYMTQAKTQADMVKILSALDSDFTPGSGAKYSNSGYLLLGYIIESITGDSYDKQLQQRITSKLGLTHTVFGTKTDSVTKADLTESYIYRGTGWLPASKTHLSVPHGAGAIVATPSDVTAFFSGLFAGKLISNASLSEMKTIEDGFGAGLFQFPFYDKTAYGHNGGIDGFSSQASYFEKDGVAFAIVANGLNYSLNDISIAMLSLFFGREYTLPDFAGSPVSLPTSQLHQYKGTYASQQLPLKITITVKGDQLIAQATGQGPLPLTPYSKYEFRFAPAGIVMQFAPGDKSESADEFTLHQGGGTYLFTKE